MPDKFQQAIIAIKSGEKETGHRLLLDIIKADPNNEIAWLWMTQTVNSDNDRLKCLQRVLKINPNNEAAQRGLAILQQKQVKQLEGERLENVPISEYATSKEKRQEPTINQVAKTISGKDSITSPNAEPAKKKRSRLTFWLASTLLLALLCCCGFGILNLGNSPVTNRTVIPKLTTEKSPVISTPTTEKTLKVPAGQLSKYVDKYSKYEEVFVYKKNGTLAERPNDLEELCLDYVFYRKKFWEYDAAGETQKADESRAAFQQINRWLDEYDKNDVETMFFDILKLENWGWFTI